MAEPDQSQPQGFKLLMVFAPFFRPYKRMIATWFLIYGAYFMAGILTPIMVKIYFDNILPSGKMHRIWIFVGLYGVYAVGWHLLYFVGIQGTVRIIESVVADLRSAVYEKLHRLTIRYFDRTLSGEIVNRVTNDTRQLLTLVGGELVNVSLQVCMGIVSLVILLIWNVNLGVVVLVFIPIYATIFRRLMPLVRGAARMWRRSEDKLWGNWGEKLKGVSIIQAYTRERSEALKHHVYGHAASDNWYRMTMFGTRMHVLGGMTASISLHSAFAMSCLLVINGDMKLGELLSLSGLIGYILTPVQTVFNLVNTWQQSMVSSERIHRILQEVEEARTTEGRRKVGRLKGSVRFEHVVFEYVQGAPVLNDISISIAAGQNVALVGHTGCGKTTLVNLLLDFYRPLSGSILIDGTPTTEIHPRDLRRNIGVVPQDPTLFRDTVRMNVTYGKPEATEAEIWRVLEVSQVDEYVRGLPQGLDTRIGGDEGVTLSEGERQRLSIARAVLIDPAIVVLDEATSSLDSLEEAKLQKAIKELLQKRTALIIAHRLSTVKTCDLVVVMERGRILEIGNPDALLADPRSVYAWLNKAHFAGDRIHG